METWTLVNWSYKILRQSLTESCWFSRLLLLSIKITWCPSNLCLRSFFQALLLQERKTTGQSHDDAIKKTTTLLCRHQLGFHVHNWYFLCFLNQISRLAFCVRCRDYRIGPHFFQLCLKTIPTLNEVCVLSLHRSSASKYCPLRHKKDVRKRM